MYRDRFQWERRADSMNGVAINTFVTLFVYTALVRLNLQFAMLYLYTV